MYLTRVSQDIIDIDMTDWAVVKADDGLHFCGIDKTDWVNLARVSSVVVEFDAAAKKGTTRSGRKYTLVGDAAGLQGVTLELWQQWASMNNVPYWEDVTDQYTKK
jgi:hypothetical protein